MNTPEGFATTLFAAGVALAQGRTVEEIAVMATVFHMLAGTLETIAFAREVFCDDKDGHDNVVTIGNLPLDISD